jgi:hypothetical protein
LGGRTVLFKKRLRKYVVLSVIIGIFLYLVSISQTLFSNSEGRFFDQNVFSRNEYREAIVQKINYERTISQIPESISPIFHNKALEYKYLLKELYLNNLSFDFLFLKGDGNPRHNMSEMGELYFIEMVLIAFAVLSLYTRNRKLLIFLSAWIFVAPIATTPMIDPHALRNAFMLPPLILLSGVGFMYVYKLTSKNFKRLLVFAVFVIWMIQFVILLERLYYLAPNKFARFWSYPAKAASEIANQRKEEFDYVLISDQIESIEFAYPVYAKVDPSLVISQNRDRSELVGYRFKRFNNVYIGNIPNGEVDNFIQSLNGSVLFIGDYNKDSQNLEGYETINSVDLSKMLVLKKVF